MLFAFGVWFQHALLTGHTIYTKFFSCLPWVNSPRLCIESQVPTSYCTDTDPSALLTVSPPSFQFKTIMKISILQFHMKFSRPFKCIGGGGFAYCNIFPQEGLVIRVIQILENELYREHWTRFANFIDEWSQCDFCFANFGVILEYLESSITTKKSHFQTFQHVVLACIHYCEGYTK